MTRLCRWRYRYVGNNTDISSEQVAAFRQLTFLRTSHLRERGERGDTSGRRRRTVTCRSTPVEHYVILRFHHATCRSPHLL